MASIHGSVGRAPSAPPFALSRVPVVLLTLPPRFLREAAER